MGVTRRCISSLKRSVLDESVGAVSDRRSWYITTPAVLRPMCSFRSACGAIRASGMRPAIFSHLSMAGWFTEGFDTLDLKEVKALHDELQA